MKSEDNKTLGKRIKGNLNKRWQGLKNVFGNDKAEKAKSALNKLKKEAKEKYSELNAEDTSGIKDSIMAVWSELAKALTELKTLCEGVDAKASGVGRAYAASVLPQQSIVLPPSPTYLQPLFQPFEDHVVLLQQIANNTPPTSSIPWVIHGAAEETSRFYAYAYAYACSESISERFEKIKENLQKERTLWNRIKKFITKSEGDFIDQLTADSNKVAREIYKKAKNAKIRSSIKTKGLMTYFKDSIQDLFGIYTDKEVMKTITDCGNDVNYTPDGGNPPPVSNMVGVYVTNTTKDIEKFYKKNMQRNE